MTSYSGTNPLYRRGRLRIAPGKRSYYDKAYLHLSGCQSGHNGCNRGTCARNAITWILDLYKRNPCKPVVNLEAFYDAGGTTTGLDAKYQGTAKDARQLGYLSWLSGSLGYTYGAYGIWNWQTDSTRGYYWSRAMQYPSSTQMKYMHDFFNGIEWWRLVPAHELIQNQPSTYLQRMVLAKSESGDLAVAYLPDNASVKMDMAAFPLKINFQPAGAPVPGGYLADAGAVYGDRGNGRTYGWSADHSDLTRKRGINADEKLDTLCHFHAGGKWELAVPNGNYSVTVSVGDAGYPSTHTVNVEGTGYWSGLSLGANQFAKLTKVVSVIDGRLTVDQGEAAEKATRVNYVEVAESSGFLVAVDSVSTGKAYSLSTAKGGALYYIDRSYTIGSLSAALNGQPMIRTANDDKYVSASAHLRFSVTQPAIWIPGSPLGGRTAFLIPQPVRLIQPPATAPVRTRLQGARGCGPHGLLLSDSQNIA